MLKSLSKWMVVGISFIDLGIAYGLNFSFSIFFVPILEEFRWSRATIAGAFSLSCLISGIGSWLGGRLIDRLGVKKILIGGSIILSFSTMASGWIREIWHLYLFFGVFAAIGTCAIGWVPNSVLLSNWFVRNRGTMVGIAFSGMGIGIFAVGPFAQYLISTFGWQTSYLLLGLMALIVLVPLNCILRNRPDECEEKPQSDRPESGIMADGKVERTHEEGEGRKDWTLGISMKTLSFWAFFSAFLFLPLGAFPVMIHQVAYLIDQGYSKIMAAFVFGAVGLLSSGGKVLFGALSDRIGRVKTVTWTFACSILGIFVLLFLPSLKSAFWIYVYAVLFGISFGARGPILIAMTSDLYRGRHYGSIFGFINFGNGIGGALGPWLGGYLHDLTGSYTITFLICIPVLMMSCLCFWIAGWSMKKRRLGQSSK
jgi:MFS family permease